MKFMLSFVWKPEIKARDEAINRFKKTGGQPPKGVKLLGRWTRCDSTAGTTFWKATTPRRWPNSATCGAI